MRQNLHKSKSFTLIELLVVIAIIGILSGLIIVTMSGAVNSAKDARRKSDVDTLRTALLMYEANHNAYPVESSSCNIGSSCTTLDSAISPNYLGTIPADPSGSYYQYQSDGSSFTVSAALSDGTAYSYSSASGFSSSSSVGVCGSASGSYVSSEPSANLCGSGNVAGTVSGTGADWSSWSWTCTPAGGTSQSCSATQLASNWIDSGHGFAVMQYEARNVSSSPVSETGGTIWINVSQADAKTACEGIGGHLLTNAEWMTLATDAENVASNWTGGSVGSGVLKRGNVGDNNAGDYDGSDPDTSESNTLARLSLANGSYIWDLSGNVWEWVDKTISGSGSQASPTGWKEFTAVTSYGALSQTDAVPSGNTYTSSQGIGQFYSDTSLTDTRALIRGGFWGGGTDAGVFALDSSRTPSFTYTTIGFRCAR